MTSTSSISSLVRDQRFTRRVRDMFVKAEGRGANPAGFEAIPAGNPGLIVEGGLAGASGGADPER